MAPPKRGTCFRLEVYLRVEISCAINQETRRENCHVVDIKRGIRWHYSPFFIFSLLGIGLLYINASVWQMLRGSIIIFTGVLSVSINCFHTFSFLSLLIYSRNKWSVFILTSFSFFFRKYFSRESYGQFTGLA